MSQSQTNTTQLPCTLQLLIISTSSGEKTAASSEASVRIRIPSVSAIKYASCWHRAWPCTGTRLGGVATGVGALQLLVRGDRFASKCTNLFSASSGDCNWVCCWWWQHAWCSMGLGCLTSDAMSIHPTDWFWYMQARVQYVRGYVRGNANEDKSKLEIQKQV